MLYVVWLKNAFNIKKIHTQSLQRYWGIQLILNSGSMLINKEKLFVPDLCLKTYSAVTKGTSRYDPYSLFYPYFFMMIGRDVRIFFSSCTLAACRVIPMERNLLILTLLYGWCSVHSRSYTALSFCNLKADFERIWTCQMNLIHPLVKNWYVRSFRTVKIVQHKPTKSEFQTTEAKSRKWSV